MFTSKADADAHDKKIALVESLTEFFMAHQSTVKVDETVAEELALLIANNKDLVAKAMKGKPEVLAEATPEGAEDQPKKPTKVAKAA